VSGRALAIALAVLLPLAACRGAEPQAAPGQAATAESGLQLIPLEIRSGGKVHRFSAELARTPEEQAIGLMYRESLAPDRAMLFPYSPPEVASFWMKNTLIPLDMIWIDSGKRIVSLTSDVPPCRAEPCPSYPPAGTSRYVLEVAGGVARQHGLKAGDVLRFEGLDNVVVR